MAKPINSPKIPQTDSIQELARFWNTHDLTDFDDQLEEVTESVFERKTMVKIPLEAKAIEAVNEMAKSKGVDSTELMRGWIIEKIQLP